MNQLATAALAAAMILFPSASRAALDVEVSFDGPATDTTFTNTAVLPFVEDAVGLTKSAKLTSIGGGRYGRGVDLVDGSGAIRIPNWEPAPTIVAHMWVATRNADAGEFLRFGQSWRIRLMNGRIGVRVDMTDSLQKDFGVVWPDDGEFHHLTLGYESGGGGKTRFFARVDFGEEFEAIVDAQLPDEAGELSIGDALDGIVDELAVGRSKSVSGNQQADAFDRWPDACPSETLCAEHVLTVLLDNHDYDVPVRIKTVYDESRCNAGSPCPLVIAIGGGTGCPTDYAAPEVVAELARASFVVATVDVHCRTVADLVQDGAVLLQLVEAKEYVMGSSPAKDIIEAGPYYATGCGPGGDVALAWALRHVDDRPRRTFARSARDLAICKPLVAAAPPESATSEALDQFDSSSDLGSGDFTWELLDHDLEAAAVARSWGRRLAGAESCHEEDISAATHAARRFRDLWQGLEPDDAPSGYFVADIGAECRTCAPADSVAFDCGVCFLANGRSGMDDACEHCVEYADASIDEGLPIDLCPIHLDDDGGDGLFADPPAGKGGCTVGSGGGGAFLIALVALFARLRRRGEARPP